MTQSSSNPDPETTPRGKLARHLRQARLDAGFTTQPPFAARLQVSVPLISMIETGRHVPPRDLLDLWLDTCQVPDLIRPYLIDFWTCAKTTSSGVREFFQKYFDAEQRATFLRLWGVLLIPGPLQTREYAHAIFLKGGMDEDEAAEQLELRMRRHEKIDGPGAAHVTALIFEAALNRMVGSPEIMVAQLKHLLELSNRRNVVIQVVSDDGSFFSGLDGEFQIASGPAITDTVVEVTVTDHVSDEPDAAAKVIALFEEIRSYALNAADSRALITEAIPRWKSRQK
jgi:transcriptional regulator with XRE-family HTH domain